MITRLNYKNFFEEIKTGLHFVLFCSMDCIPCQDFKGDLIVETIKAVKRGMISEISLHEFHVHQLNAKELLTQLRVNAIPRCIVFKDGIEVGRLFVKRWGLDTRWERLNVWSHRFLCRLWLRKKFVELRETGRMTPDRHDMEELGLLYDKVFEKLNRKHQDEDGREDRKEQTARERWNSDFKQAVDCVACIVTSRPYWNALTDDEVEGYLVNI